MKSFQRVLVLLLVFSCLVPRQVECGWLSDAWDSVTDTVSGVWDSVTGWGGDVISAPSNFADLTSHMGDMKGIMDKMITKMGEMQNIPAELENRIRSVMNDAFGKVSATVNDVEKRAYQFLEHSTEKAEQMLHDAYSKANILMDRGIKSINNVLDSAEIMVNGALDRQEEIVTDALMEAADMVESMTTDIKSIEEDMINSLWDMIDRIECIALSTVQSIEIIINSLLESVMDPNHECRRIFNITDKVVPTHDLIMNYELIKCKIFLGIDEFSTIDEIYVRHGLLAQRLQYFRCMAQGNTILSPYFRYEMKKNSDAALYHGQFISNSSSSLGAMAMRCTADVSSSYNTLDLSELVSSGIPASIQSVIQMGGSLAKSMYTEEVIFCYGITVVIVLVGIGVAIWACSRRCKKREIPFDPVKSRQSNRHIPMQEMMSNQWANKRAFYTNQGKEPLLDNTKRIPFEVELENVCVSK